MRERFQETLSGIRYCLATRSACALTHSLTSVQLEDEFRKDGIQVTWSFLRGAGPATNELYANGLADFLLLGDLPSIIGHS